MHNAPDPRPGTHCAGRAALPCASGRGGRCHWLIVESDGGFPHGRCAVGFFCPPDGLQCWCAATSWSLLRCQHAARRPTCRAFRAGAALLRPSAPGFPTAVAVGFTRVAGAPCVSRRRAHSFFRHLVFPAQACWRSPARWWAGALPGSLSPRLGFVLCCAARRVWAGGWAVCRQGGGVLSGAARLHESVRGGTYLGM